MTYTLILTILYASMWDGSPIVKYEQRVENLTAASCQQAADEFKRQNGTHERTTVIALCIQKAPT